MPLTVRFLDKSGNVFEKRNISKTPRHVLMSRNRADLWPQAHNIVTDGTEGYRRCVRLIYHVEKRDIRAEAESVEHKLAHAEDTILQNVQSIYH